MTIIILQKTVKYGECSFDIRIKQKLWKKQHEQHNETKINNIEDTP